MVLNVFFGPLSISYDAWMMSHTKFKKLILRLKIGPKMTLGPLFPQDLGVKFSKNFLAQNCIKRHFRYLLFPPQKVGSVYAPIRHTGCLENFLPKSRVYTQMEKLGGCAWWVHILGVGRGPNKVPYHTFMPYQYQLLTLRQSKVMPSQNKLPKSRFSKGLPLKPSILLLQRANRLLGEKVTLGPIFKRKNNFFNLV